LRMLRHTRGEWRDASVTGVNTNPTRVVNNVVELTKRSTVLSELSAA
jgi:hypothetical protein